MSTVQQSLLMVANEPIIQAGFNPALLGFSGSLPSVTYTESSKRVEASGTSSQFAHSRAYRERNSGKFYFEFEMLNGSNATSLGWFRSATPLNNAEIQGGTNTNVDSAAGFYLGTLGAGQFAAGGSVALSTGLTGTGVYMFAVDASAGKIWVGKTGSWYSGGNPASGTGALTTGITIAPGSPGLTQQLGFGTADCRIKTAASDMTYSIPSGFIAYANA